MKTNYLSAMALIGLLTFSNCSKDDATTETKTTEVEKSTVVLEKEENITVSNDIAQNVNQVGDFDQVIEGSNLMDVNIALKNTAVTGPEICGQKPTGKPVIAGSNASLDFKYDFGTSGDCKLNDASIKGILIISVDAKKNITLKFENFYRKDVQTNQTIETTYNGTIKAPFSTIADKRTYITDLTTTTKRTDNVVLNPYIITSRVTLNFNVSTPSVGYFYKTISIILNGSSTNYRVSIAGGLGGASKNLSTTNGIGNFSISASNLKFDNTCKQKLVGGEFKIEDATLSKNNTTVTFGDCASKKWTIKNDSKEYFVTF